MKKLHVRHFTNRDKQFYSLLGPFLAKREVHEAIGLPPWDDEGKEWFIFETNGRIDGFGGAILTGDKITFCSDYIIPEADLDDVLTALIRARIEWATGKAIIGIATVAKAHQATYRMCGFSGKTKARTKNYLQMEKTF